MAQELSQLIEALPLGKWIAVIFLLLARIGPVVFIAPFLGGRRLPATIRIVIVGALTLALWPTAWVSSGDLPESGVLLMLLVIKEGLAGMVLALMVSLLFTAIEAGGRIIDVVRGAQMAQVLTGQSTDPSSPVGALLLLFSVVVFMAIGGHLMVISALERSYFAIPIAGWPSTAGWSGTARLAIYLGGEFFLVALGVAAPVLAAAFVLDLSLGLAGRLAPQMPAYFVGLPVKAWGGILLLFLCLPWVLAWSRGVFEMSVRFFVQAVQSLGT